jgi:hypothetical protein
VTPYQFMVSARNVLNQIAESYSRWEHQTGNTTLENKRIQKEPVRED